MTDVLERLLARHRPISEQVSQNELRCILRELDAALQRSGGRGIVVEFGCYIGTTSLFIRRYLDSCGVKGRFYVFDSFEGLPSKSSPDHSPSGEQFVPGALRVSRKDFEKQFKKAGLNLPYIHKGWFDQIEQAAIPSDIVFAFLDGDYFASIRDSLRLITPQLRLGATIVVDDYANEALPGVAKAVEEWAGGRQVRIRVEQSLAIITVL